MNVVAAAVVIAYRFALAQHGALHVRNGAQSD